MITDDQLIERIKTSLKAEVANLEPPTELLEQLRGELDREEHRSKRRRPRWLPSAGGVAAALATASAVAVAILAIALLGHGRSDHGGATTMPRTLTAVIQNPDGTVHITLKKLSEVDGLNQQVAELGIRVKALRADPGCTATVNELDWGQLYPRIVTENGPAPGVTIQPNAIPANDTLLLAAQEITPRVGQPLIVTVVLKLVRSPAPDCIGEVLRPAKPPPPGVGVPPRSLRRSS
jgi:hypothetical protein